MRASSVEREGVEETGSKEDVSTIIAEPVVRTSAPLALFLMRHRAAGGRTFRQRRECSVAALRLQRLVVVACALWCVGTLLGFMGVPLGVEMVFDIGALGALAQGMWIARPLLRPASIEVVNVEPGD